jgi:hypothetical protein
MSRCDSINVSISGQKPSREDLEKLLDLIGGAN